MYATEVDGRTLNLAVSGKLWKRGLIMRDEETGTEWSQLLCRGMKGEYSGRELEVLPSSLMDWKTWKTKHPETTVINLSKTGREFTKSFYKKPSRFVIGLANDNMAKAWSFDRLNDQPVVNDQFAGEPILVLFNTESGSAHIYSRKLGGEVLQFSRQGNEIVDESGTKWIPETGIAKSGPWERRELKQLPAIPSFKSSWQSFYPDSEFWNPH